MKTTHHLRHLRGAVLAACMATLASCSVAYRPSSLIGPGRIDDHHVLAGPARVSLRFGAEWVELGLENIGQEPIEVDWSRIVLAESDVETHYLRELPVIREGISRPYGTHTAIRTRYSLTAQHPLPLPEIAESARERIAPGKSRVALLYVSEHIKVEDGTTIVGPLFCHSPAQHAQQQHAVQLLVPVRIGQREDVLRLEAVVQAF